MDSENTDKMDELILASLQELCVPPGNAHHGGEAAGASAKRSYKRHLTDTVKKGVCQVIGCDQPLLTPYSKKYRVCNVHVKSPEVHIHDDTQRFCQKCSRFHPVAEFDGYRRTCRIRLAQHNTRRRLIRAMQRADREASPNHSSGEDVRSRRRTYLGAGDASHQVPHYQPPPMQLPSRPAGTGDMHAALLQVALASLGDSGDVDTKPATYSPHSYVPPTAPTVYRPPAYHHAPVAPPLPPPPPPPPQQQASFPPGTAEALLNSIDPQQLMQMLQLIISLQQMGCSLDQLDHPEVLPLMMTLLQNA